MENINYLKDDVDHAKKMMELARLEKSEISPIIQSLSVKEDQEDLYVLQLNNCVLNEIKAGNVLTIRGEATETAVMCTDSSTYELREAETSNSLLVLPDLYFPTADDCDFTLVPQAICGIFHTYFELRNFNPSFKKLRAVLGKNSYKGRQYENSDLKNYTFVELLDIIQTSQEELKKALENLQTCVINNCVRILDFDYKFNILSQIVHVIESRSIPLDRIPKDDILKTLQDGIHEDVLEKCFHWYTSEVSDDIGSQIYALDNDAVCKAYAEFLLHAAGKFHLAEFLESWQKSVPEGMQCDLSQLYGVALVDKNYQPEIIFYFPAHDMPENLTDRFNKLFKAKEKWTYDEIFPYLQDKTAGNDVRSLLIKYTRESLKDGVKLYCSKW